ncbi:hypothetical protein NOSIN_12160 [Nocardiopsis sinuspersici]|uniref:Uncharacterized protein n=1 Tax=Nocardiopsis sinuspersici TaxID=501010 RepID=A0A1V3C947_9ACTN|nr:hypothetical protein NOSIN_12160 [Nocardiopsis sinuspersici]
MEPAPAEPSAGEPSVDVTPLRATAGRPGRSRVTRRAAAFARLTWFNTVRLCRNPLLALGMAAGSYMIMDMGRATGVLTLESWHNRAGSIATVVGVVMFAVVTFPAMREARYSTALVSPLGRTSRLLSLMAASSLVSTVMVAVLAGLQYWMASPPLVGTLSPPAYPAPLLLAAAGPLLSITLVAWTRSYLPLVVVGLTMPVYALYGVSLLDNSLQSAAFRMQWAVRVTMQPFKVRAPSVTDVAAHYLVYAVLAVAVLVFLALAARGGRAFRAACLGTIAVLLACALLTVAHGRQTYTPLKPIADSQVYGAHGPSCQTREGITYCPLPGYEPWVDRWHETLAPAVDLLPEEAHGRLPVVWQDGSSYERDLDVPEDRSVMVYSYMNPGWTYWRAELVGGVVRSVLDLSSPYEPRRCRATDQSRVVIAAWLTTVGEGASRTERLDALTMGLDPYLPSPVDLEVARALVGLPEERVGRVLEQHWDRLSSPGGRTRELAELLGLRVRAASGRPATSDDWRRLYPHQPYGEVADEPVWRGLPVCS